jgi:glyoxylase-like metal-dependent hydrolase (beta-lactamase superfamily II)
MATDNGGGQSFDKGLHDLGNGCWAYLQPDGSWGYSNAGLVEDSGETLLVDTLFDLPLTREMLEAMRDAVPAAASIGTLVNTHSNPDHTYGNQLVREAEMISSEACLEEMAQQLRDNVLEKRQEQLDHWEEMGDEGFLVHDTFASRFDFRGIELTLPTRTFSDRLSLTVGTKPVDLINVGPAHTGGDVIIHVPGDRIVFTGDIMFNRVHPPTWAGPVTNWIKACDLILDLDADVIVPGHGAVADKDDLREFKSFFEYLHDEVRGRFDAGLGVRDATDDIDLRQYGSWLDPERLVVNVNALYRDFGSSQLMTRNEMRAYMGRYRRLDQDQCASGHHNCSHNG